MLIRKIFKLALRQAERFMDTNPRIVGAAIVTPEFSCIPKRKVELPAILMTKALKPGSAVMVDSFELQVYGKDEWRQRQQPHARAAVPL